VQGGERVGDAVLLEVVADGHLAAEAVAAEGDGHLAGGIGRGLDEDGDVEVGEAEGVGEAALFAEVGQGDDDAVDLVGVLLEEFGTLLGVFVGLDRAVGGDFGVSTMGLMPAASSAAIISRRPLVARWLGKNPRLPTRTPIVI
jgi:hypothetical protein